MKWRQAVIVRPFIQLILFTMAFYTCISRVVDYKHHWSDVLAGAIWGLVVAVLMVSHLQCISYIWSQFIPKLLIHFFGDVGQGQRSPPIRNWICTIYCACAHGGFLLAETFLDLISIIFKQFHGVAHAGFWLAETFLAIFAIILDGFHANLVSALIIPQVRL